jgi:hypothetical protein
MLTVTIFKVRKCTTRVDSSELAPPAMIVTATKESEIGTPVGRMKELPMRL